MTNKKPVGLITCRICRGTTYVFEPIEDAEATAQGSTATARMTKKRCTKCKDGFVKFR